MHTYMHAYIRTHIICCTYRPTYTQAPHIYTHILYTHICTRNTYIVVVHVDVVILRPPTGLLFILQVVGYMSMESYGRISTGGNRRNQRKKLSQCPLSTTNPTVTELDTNPGLRGERPATNRLSLMYTLHTNIHHTHYICAYIRTLYFLWVYIW
jgi:hypothetical protein